MLALSSLSFDLSVYDIFGMLAAGGCIVMPEEDALRDPEDWAALIERERVTVWNTVPAFMELLVAHAEHARERLPACLRLVWLSGDWIPPALPAPTSWLEMRWLVSEASRSVMGRGPLELFSRSAALKLGEAEMCTCIGYDTPLYAASTSSYMVAACRELPAGSKRWPTPTSRLMLSRGVAKTYSI